MNYYLYLFICWFTHPFRWLMPFWKDKHFSFAVWLLFRNVYKRSFIYAQIRHETGNFTSNKWVNNNNPCGMAYIKGKYQSGAYISPLTGEPTSTAVYSSQYQGIYDLYNYYYERVKSSGKSLDFIPNSPFDKDAPVDQNYFYNVCSRLKTNGFYTGTLTGYYNAVQSAGVHFQTNIWRIIVCVVYAVFLPCFGVWLYLGGRVRNIFK